MCNCTVPCILPCFGKLQNIYLGYILLTSDQDRFFLRTIQIQSQADKRFQQMKKINFSEVTS